MKSKNGLVYKVETLFAIFVFVGMIITGLKVFETMIVKPMTYWVDAKKFIAVPAVLAKLEMALSHGDTKISVRAQYSYRYKGKEYQSMRVTLDDSPESNSDYWEDVYDRVYSQYLNNQLNAFIDPGNPSASILVLDIKKVGVAFGWMFTCISWLIAYGFFLILKGRFKSVGSTIYAKAGILSSEAGEPLIIRLVAKSFLVTSFILVPCLTLIAFNEEVNGVRFYIVLLLPFTWPVIGVLIYRYYLREDIKFKAIGNTRLVLDPVNGMNAGDIAGYFDVMAEPIGDMRFTLSCNEFTEKVSTGNKPRQDPEMVSLLNLKQVAKYKVQSGRGYRVFFMFSGFKELPPTGDIDDRVSIMWHLICEGDVKSFKLNKAMAFKRSWEVPVVKGGIKSDLRVLFPNGF